MLDQEFENVLKLEKATPDINRLEQDLEQEKKRLQEARDKARATGDTGAQQILTQRVDGERMVQNVETSLAAARGDQDAGDKAQNRLLDLKIAIDEVEDSLEWPALVAQAEEKITEAHKIIDQYGTPEAKRKLSQLENETRQAIQGKDVDQVKRKVDEIDTLTVQVLIDQPEFWVSMFQNLEGRKAAMRDQNQAEQLILQGNRAIQANDLPRVKATVRQLLSLLPVDQQRQVGGFGSGVMG